MRDLVDELQSLEVLARDFEYPNNNTKADDIRDAIILIKQQTKRIEELEAIAESARVLCQRLEATDCPENYQHLYAQILILDLPDTKQEEVKRAIDSGKPSKWKVIKPTQAQIGGRGVSEKKLIETIYHDYDIRESLPDKDRQIMELALERDEYKAKFEWAAAKLREIADAENGK